MAATAVVAWLSFLHVPVLDRYGGVTWSAALVLLGGALLRPHRPS